MIFIGFSLILIILMLYVLKIYFNSVFITPPYDATKFIDELKYHYPSNINATIEFEPILPQWLLSFLPFQCGNPPVFSAHIKHHLSLFSRFFYLYHRNHRFFLQVLVGLWIEKQI